MTSPIFTRQTPAAGSNESFEIDLKKGWNVLLTKITAGAGKPATTGLRVAGEEIRTAGTPAELPVPAAGGP